MAAKEINPLSLLAPRSSLLAPGFSSSRDRTGGIFASTAHRLARSSLFPSVFLSLGFRYERNARSRKCVRTVTPRSRYRGAG